MKRRTILLVTFLLGFICAGPTRAQIQCSISGYSSPTGIAWEPNIGNIWVAVYGGNFVARLSGCAEIARYSTGRGPFGIASDGVNMWVTNYGDGTVTKINIGTGRTVGTYAVGSHPRGVIFQGNYIFVANESSNTITKLDASTGALLGTFTVGSAPYNLASAGSTFWVANLNSNTVMQLDLNGSILQTLSTPSQPQYLAFAQDSYGNQRLFVSCYSGKKVAAYNVTTSPASLINNVDVSAYSYPTGVVTLPNGPGSIEARVEVVTHGGYLLDLESMGTPNLYSVHTVIPIETSSPSKHLLSVIVGYPNYNPYLLWMDDVDDGMVYSYNFD